MDTREAIRDILITVRLSDENTVEASTDAILALFAGDREALLAESESVEMGRDWIQDRYDEMKVKRDAAEAREAKLREALDSLLSAIEDWHGSQRGEYCDEMCDRLHMAMDKADDALAKEGK